MGKAKRPSLLKDGRFIGKIPFFGSGSYWVRTSDPLLVRQML